jgi:16S rRNA (guanine527-N7)-methyltransferase
LRPQGVSREIPGLRALAERYGLEEGRLAATLVALVGEEHAPTAIRELEQALQVHLADSLVGLEIEAVRAAGRIADLGSGSGFPGVALAIALPAAQIQLVEAQGRRCAYLERLCGAAGVANTRVVCARAEEWAEGIGLNDVVVARALAGQPVVLEYAAPLLGLGGTLVDWRGRRLADEEEAGTRAAAELGLRRMEVRHVQPFAQARDHHLHVFVKEQETPPRFPRRPGMARKRPLGGGER